MSKKSINPEAERVRQAALEILKLRNEDELLLRERVDFLIGEVQTLTEINRELLNENVALKKGSVYFNSLIDANQILRSCKSIADRDGKDTNWSGIKAQLERILVNQHELLYPKGTKDSSNDH